MKILLLLLAIFINLNANAMEGGFGQTITSIDEPIEHEVTVGEVDASLGTYDIEIEWGLLEFDYVYDEETDSYKWQHPHGASEAMFSITNNNHTNYPVIPTVTWNSSEKYDFVKGIIKEVGTVCVEEEYNEEEFNQGVQLTGAQCNAKPAFSYNDPNHSYDENKYYILGERFKNLIDNKPEGQIGPNIMYYLLGLFLENDSTKEVKTPAMGDTIGTLTITFEAEEPNGQ